MENPRIDFEEEMYDQCAHSYQDGFNSGYKQGQIDTIKRFCNITPPKTNADRIRSMTDEELAEYLFERGNKDEYCYGICVNQDDVNACVKALKQDGCIRSIVAWLKQEIKTN